MGPPSGQCRGSQAAFARRSRASESKSRLCARVVSLRPGLSLCLSFSLSPCLCLSVSVSVSESLSSVMLVFFNSF